MGTLQILLLLQLLLVPEHWLLQMAVGLQHHSAVAASPANLISVRDGLLLTYMPLLSYIGMIVPISSRIRTTAGKHGSNRPDLDLESERL